MLDFAPAHAASYNRLVEVGPAHLFTILEGVNVNVLN